MGMFLCRDKFSGSNRGQFEWKGSYKTNHGLRTVNCNSTCTACSTIYKGVKELIDTSSYKQVYEYCKNHTRYTPPNNDQVDTTITNVKPTGKLVFDSAATTVYGFDSWRDAKVKNDADKINYVSVEAGCSTFVKIILPEDMFSAYWKIFAKLPSAFSNGVSFTNVGTSDSLLLTDTVTYVPIYAKTTAIRNTPISMEVIGIDDPAQPVTLAGNKYGNEDKLEIIIFDNKKYDRTKCKVYLVNSPTFNPDSATWSNGFNQIIKQGVINMDGLEIMIVNDWSWDLNGNKSLDDFVSYDSVPVEYIEYFELLEAIGEYDDGCDINEYSATIVLNDKIKSHYLLMENIAPGSTLVRFNTVKGLEIGKDYYLGPWLGGSGNYEWVTITHIDTILNCISVDSIQFNHNVEESIYIEDYVKGFAYKSCSCVGNSIDYKIYVHEFLHHYIVGALSDVEDDGNIMNYYYHYIGNLMRYRTLNSFNGPENQWSQLTR